MRRKEIKMSNNFFCLKCRKDVTYSTTYPNQVELTIRGVPLMSARCSECKEYQDAVKAFKERSGESD